MRVVETRHKVDEVRSRIADRVEQLVLEWEEDGCPMVGTDAVVDGDALRGICSLIRELSLAESALGEAIQQDVRDQAARLGERGL